MKAVALLAVLMLCVGCTAPIIPPIIPETGESVVEISNHAPIFSSTVLLNGIPSAVYLPVGNRCIVDMLYRAADERGPWTGIYDPDGDPVTVLSVRAWMVMDGEEIEDAVYFPQTVTTSAFVLYPGIGRWYVDGQLVSPVAEPGYASPTVNWAPFRSTEGCGATYQPPSPYVIEVEATDGQVVVTHRYTLTIGATWGSDVWDDSGNQLY